MRLTKQLCQNEESPKIKCNIARRTSISDISMADLGEVTDIFSLEFHVTKSGHGNPTIFGCISHASG